MAAGDEAHRFTIQAPAVTPGPGQDPPSESYPGGPPDSDSGHDGHVVTALKIDSGSTWKSGVT